MAKEEHSELGEIIRAVRITDSHAAMLILAFAHRSESRRGYVLEIDGSLVRVREDDQGWIAERLRAPVWLSESASHQHSVTPVTLSDGHDVIVCEECGSEW